MNDDVMDVIGLARVVTPVVVMVLLVGAAVRALPEIWETGDVDVVGDFVVLVVLAMLLIGLLAWAWSWFDAVS